MANLDLQDAHLLVPAHEDFKKYNCALYFKLLPTSSRSYFSVSVKVHLFIYVFIRYAVPSMKLLKSLLIHLYGVVYASLHCNNYLVEK